MILFDTILNFAARVALKRMLKNLPLSRLSRQSEINIETLNSFLPHMKYSNIPRAIKVLVEHY